MQWILVILSIIGVYYLFQTDSSKIEACYKYESSICDYEGVCRNAIRRDPTRYCEEYQEEVCDYDDECKSKCEDIVDSDRSYYCRYY